MFEDVLANRPFLAHSVFQLTTPSDKTFYGLVTPTPRSVGSCEASGNREEEFFGFKPLLFGVVICLHSCGSLLLNFINSTLDGFLFGRRSNKFPRLLMTPARNGK